MGSRRKSAFACVKRADAAHEACEMPKASVDLANCKTDAPAAHIAAPRRQAIDKSPLFGALDEGQRSAAVEHMFPMECFAGQVWGRGDCCATAA